MVSSILALYERYLSCWDVSGARRLHVIYGNSRSDAKLKVAVNATSGEFLRIEKS